MSYEANGDQPAGHPQVTPGHQHTAQMSPTEASCSVSLNCHQLCVHLNKGRSRAEGYLTREGYHNIIYVHPPNLLGPANPPDASVFVS